MTGIDSEKLVPPGHPKRWRESLIETGESLTRNRMRIEIKLKKVPSGGREIKMCGWNGIGEHGKGVYIVGFFR